MIPYAKCTTREMYNRTPVVSLYKLYVYTRSKEGSTLFMICQGLDKIEFLWYNSHYMKGDAMEKIQNYPPAQLTEEQVQQIYNYAVQTRQLVREVQAELATLKAELRLPQSPMESYARNREQEYEEGITQGSTR